MDFHEALMTISIIVEIIGILVGILHIMGFRVKNLLHKKDENHLIKQNISIKSKLLTYLIVVPLIIFLTYQILGEDVWKIIFEHWEEVLIAIWRMLILSLISIILGTLFGGLLAYLITREKKYVIEEVLTEIVLGGSIYILLALPAIVIIYISYYGGFTDSLWIASTLALSINLSPFVAKILVESFRSISKEQIDAAHAFGYSEAQITRYFKISYVLQYSIQPLLVEYYTTIKLSSLTSYIGFMEILHVSQDIIKETQDPIRGYIILSISYIIIVAPIAFLADRLDQKYKTRKNE